jgi:hypothetical protein
MSNTLISSIFPLLNLNKMSSPPNADKVDKTENSLIIIGEESV